MNIRKRFENNFLQGPWWLKNMFKKWASNGYSSSKVIWKHKNDFKIWFLTFKNLYFDTKTIFLSFYHQYLHLKQFSKFRDLPTHGFNSRGSRELLEGQISNIDVFFQNILIKNMLVKARKKLRFFIFANFFLKIRYLIHLNPLGHRWPSVH